MQNTKRVFLIHGWDGNPRNHWFPWLQEELEQRDFVVVAPAMPDTSHPKIDEWVSELSRVVGIPDKETYFVGHSVGCQTILRFLEKLSASQEVGGAVFVGGWFTLTNLETQEEKEIAKPWLEIPINFENVKKHANKFAAVFSDDDELVPLENRALFEESLGAETSVEHKKGHFCKGDGVTELHSALEALLKISGYKS